MTFGWLDATLRLQRYTVSQKTIQGRTACAPTRRPEPRILCSALLHARNTSGE